jgi:hypothetical protein
MTLMQEIEQKANLLSAEERELLAERLLSAASGAPLSTIEEAWVEEAERRYDAWRAGRIEAVESKKALMEVREELRR